MSVKILMTAEELLERSHEFGPCELVRGEIVPMPPGGELHSGVSINAAYLLQAWARRTRLGRVWGNEAGLVTQRDPDTVRGAEAVYMSYKRRPKGQRRQGFTDQPPELVVEVVGKGQGWNDAVAKAEEYLEFGVDRVWLLHPGRRRLWVYRRNHEPLVLDENDVITDEEILPGFSCRVGEFFED